MKTAKKPLRDAVLYPCEIFDLIQPNAINEALRQPVVRSSLGFKTKFTIDSEIFSNGKLEECYALYEQYYKEDGWELDKEREQVFMIIDKEINLSVGDRVNMNIRGKAVVVGDRVVTWKCLKVLDGFIEYDLEEE